MMILLIDERPEEVTDMEEICKCKLLLLHLMNLPEKTQNLRIWFWQKRKRMVEYGHDVVIFLDSITKISKSLQYRNANSGKVLSGGVDANAMHKPKDFSGLPRKIENGGSLNHYCNCTY